MGEAPAHFVSVFSWSVAHAVHSCMLCDNQWIHWSVIVSSLQRRVKSQSDKAKFTTNVIIHHSRMGCSQNIPTLRPGCCGHLDSSTGWPCRAMDRYCWWSPR